GVSYLQGRPYGVALKYRDFEIGWCMVYRSTKLEGTVTAAYVPWEYVLGFFAVLLAFASRDLQAGLRLKRNARRYFEQCGYDLRATPKPGGAILDRCPECGAMSLGYQNHRRGAEGAEDAEECSLRNSSAPLR